MSFDSNEALLQGSPKIVLRGIPMPPSTNKQYITFHRQGKVYRVKSTDSKRYDVDFTAWAWLNKRILMDALNQLNGMGVEIETFFGFHKKKLIGQRGQFKRLDVTNRLKALHDNLCAAIGIDDSQFISSYEEKFIIEDKEKEQVIIRLTPAPIRVLSQISILL